MAMISNMFLYLLIGVGFLEDIQITSSYKKIKYVEYEKWLGEKSQQIWYEIIKMWEGKYSLMEVIRGEKRLVAQKKVKKQIIIKSIILLLLIVIFILAWYTKK